MCFEQACDRHAEISWENYYRQQVLHSNHQYITELSSQSQVGLTKLATNRDTTGKKVLALQCSASGLHIQHYSILCLALTRFFLLGHLWRADS